MFIGINSVNAFDTSLKVYDYAQILTTKEEQKLYNDLLKLINQANSRLARLEKITGLRESFSSKELADFLSTEGLNALTKSGRISKRKDYTLMQMQAIEKLLNKFIDEGISSAKDVKSYTTKVSKMLGQKVTIKQADVFYRMTHDYRWIYEYFDSDFWKTVAPLTKTQDVETWQKTLETYAHGDIIKEPNLRYKVIALYHYVRGD